LDKGNPWSRGLPEKLTGCQLVKTSPALYRTRRFITAFRKARRLSLSRVTSTQSIHFLKIPFNTVLLSTHRFSKCSLPLTSYHQNPACTSPLSHTCYIPLQIYSSLFDHRSNIRWEAENIMLLVMLSFPVPFTSSFLSCKKHTLCAMFYYYYYLWPVWLYLFLHIIS
jgi:hypothetical protein